MTSAAGSDPLVRGVDDVLITAELASRPSRAPDYESESRALGLLAQEMATNPRGVLQKCAELVMELCHADSAGISILEPGGASGMLRWHAAADGFAANLHGTMPREASPCGTVMERNCVLLFHEAERFFPALGGVEPRIYENLLAPWHAEGEAVGTLWAIRHTPDGRFDAEDARVLQSLARFAAAAFQMITALDEATAKRTELEQRTTALRESEERQGFLLKLSDAVRGLAIPADIQGETTSLLRERLNAAWCYYVDWDLDRKVGLVLRDSASEGLPSLAGAHDVFDAPEFLRLLAEGAVLTVRDYASYEQLSTRIRRKFTALGFRSMMAAPLVKEGRLISTLLVGDTKVRDWSANEASLLGEVAERTWAAVERARAEQAFRESEGRARLLLAELQHRVRNILAMIRSVVTRTAREDVSAFDYAQHLAGRVDAMARTQAILTRRPGEGIEIEDLVRDELLAQVAAEDRFRLSGPAVLLSPKAAEVLTLAVHELATNSIKYGALGAGEELRISWKVEARDGERWVTIVWEEAGAKDSGAASRRGFGTELITRRVPYELEGSGAIEFGDHGMRATVAFPLTAKGSILEAGPSAPREAERS